MNLLTWPYREHGSRTHLSRCWTVPLRPQTFQPGSLVGQLCSFPSQSSAATSIYIFTTKSHPVMLNMQRWVWPLPQHINPTFHSDERLADIAGRDRGGAETISSFIFFTAATVRTKRIRQHVLLLIFFQNNIPPQTSNAQTHELTKKKNTCFSYKSLMHLLSKVWQDFSAADDAVQPWVMTSKTAQQRAMNRSAWIYLSEPSLCTGSK